MAHYQIILAYDGTQFAGFQRLDSYGCASHNRTVQSEIEKVLSDLGWTGNSILSAGRTDQGVHASGQVITFDLEWKHSDQELCRALNAKLPRDIAAQSVQTVPEKFHPRYAAKARCYRYQIYCQENRNPILERYAWRVWPAVNSDLLNKVASLLIGKHDFKAFGKPPRRNGNSVRTIWKAHWEHDYESIGLDRLRFEIIGDAFLYHMVRHLVFTQVQIGQGKLEKSDLENALENGILRTSGLAPANGLILTNVLFDD
jgi:tRNA pseudouridine38-40 synthase